MAEEELYSSNAKWDIGCAQHRPLAVVVSHEEATSAEARKR